MIDGLARWLRVEQRVDGDVLAAGLFQHRYRSEIPHFPHHVVGNCRTIDGTWRPAAYIHFTDRGDFLLGGGACVDDRVLRQLPQEAREALRAAGGLYRACLEWAIAHYSPSHQAIFGYCGDRLAERIDLAAGFRRTGHPHLLIRTLRPLSDEVTARMIAAANAEGPF